MKTIDDLLVYLREKEKMLGKGEIARNTVFELLLEQNRPVVIYGAGALGHEIYDTLARKNVKLDFFCSGLKSGYVDDLTGLLVINKDELVAYSDSIVIFAIGDTASKEEKEQLIENIISMGFNKNQIMNHSIFEEKVSPSFLLEHEQEITEVYNFLSDDESKKIYIEKLKYMVEYTLVEFECSKAMYIDDDIVNFSNHEIMIDAGAYNGDTALLFRHVAGASADIYSFEPDFSNYNELNKQVKGKGNIFLENLGLWNTKGTLCFSDNQNGSSHIENNGTMTIKVTDLDSYCKEKGIIPTYIKMDIEGAEKEAILGAKESIEKNKPKLAICLYHRPEDIFEIPILIHRINPSYKMYIRHYSNYRTDTLLYAV